MSPVRIFSSRMSAGIGGALWVAFVLWRVTDSKSLAWSTALLGFGALVMVPLLLELVQSGEEKPLRRRLIRRMCTLQFPAAVLLLLSCVSVPGVWTSLLAVPWIMLTAVLGAVGVWGCWRLRFRPLWVLCQDAGLVFIAVGGAWTLADRLGLHPLGFGTDIVQLTAVHFHFAGLVLPVTTGLILREFPSSRAAALAGWGVVAGVPLVAIGITSSQLWANHAIELLAALVLAGSAMVVAGLQLRLAMDNRHPAISRLCWAVAGFSLFFGMSLALLYAARFWFSPLPWLDLPWMRALHGSANALGFSFCGAVGWRIVYVRRSAI